MNGAWGVKRNYHAHAKEMGGEAPSTPNFFFMPPTAVVEADKQGNVAMSLGNSENQIEHEVELVVKLGKHNKPVLMAIGCDTTDRTIQAEAKRKGISWIEAKGFPGAAVIGTWVPYKSGEYEIGLTVNGELRQISNTSLMIHSVEVLISALSEKENLIEGDLIFTGTPAGVGSLTPGDKVKAWLKDDQQSIMSYFLAICK
ncbi:MAG: acylpyruvase [Thermoplasmata archaeon]|nr:acylpyruvase [Thermoplasmata archaeon]|tara:strand:- start:829 stop:1428 length:600 start_codon:yes stop_codon:yes gene_type:complete